MGDYVKPLQRNVGVVALVMECMSVAGWVSSLIYHNAIEFPAREHVRHFIHSGDGRIAWLKTFSDAPTNKRDFHCWNEPLNRGLNRFNTPEKNWKWQFYGFGVSERSWPGTKVEIFIFPPWFIAIPLALLPAWRLLRMPRIAKPVSHQAVTSVEDREMNRCSRQ